jgi:predicted RNA-binding protein associated with RNAse of E/G family
VEDPAAPLTFVEGDAIHPPKRETFDLAARTNTDPKGIVRAVDEYEVYAWGLYLARPTPGRAQFHYLESWLLPSLGLRATVFHFNPGHERDHDYYLDVGEFTPGPDVWRSEDHYLDIEVRTGTSAALADVDELLEAIRQGLLMPEVAELAVRRAVVAVDGLARNGYDLARWLAEHGVQLSWRGSE